MLLARYIRIALPKSLEIFGRAMFQKAYKVREIAEREHYELTQGTLDFIEAHMGRVMQPTLPLW